METWETTWKRITTSEKIKEEYKKAFLLNIFKKFCFKLNKDGAYKNNIYTLYRQTSDVVNTTKIIIEDVFEYELSEAEAKLLWEWIDAFRRKSSSRKNLSLELKKELYDIQGGVCPLCNQPLGKDWSRIHVDHIIPWSLVGDELKDNYQDLCETCNESKSSRTDYIFNSLIHMN